MTLAVSYVVDASVAVKLHLAEPLASEAHTLFALLANQATTFHVPDLFFVECANILWKQVQRGNATAEQATAHLAALYALPLQHTTTFDLSPNALPLALAHNISAYDACYLALAQRAGIPFITADEKLARKMAGSPYPVTWLGNWSSPVTS